MEDWVLRSLARWPDVPALYGWLALDRRGRWLIKGEPISRPQIIETINRNYSADAQGRWYFQNGPQRGYMRLDYAPLILRTEDESLYAHTGSAATPIAAFLDQEGSLLFETTLGPGLLADTELNWALERLRGRAGLADESSLAEALTLPSGAATSLYLALAGIQLPLQRLDFDAAPAALGFVRDPQPLPGESASR
jgi:hypothetical protein